MDLAETMKSVLAKNSSSGGSSSSSGTPHGAEGYVTEKLYMLLQLYLQNKGWSPSIELLQCFSELKDSSMLPSTAYLQMMAARVGLDSQGRLILRENGKIILPYEHFANAVMLKHMNGPHGLHLGIEATVRAVVESYTIGREQFGMEKEFIIEVVQNCPNPACRYYKSQLEMTQKTLQQHLAQQPTYLPGILNTGTEVGSSNISESQAVERLLRGAGLPSDFQLPLTPHLAALSNMSTGEQPSKSSSISSSNEGRMTRAADKHQQQLREAMMQQSRALSHNSNNMDKYSQRTPSQPTTVHEQLKQQKSHHYPEDHKLTDFLRANLESLESLSSGTTQTSQNNQTVSTSVGGSVSTATVSSSSNSSNANTSAGGQDRVVRAFSDLARNLQRMRPCVRPAMCKPYGKQSEQLQKILMDTIQLVQSLRSYLPPPHIQVSSWKNDDKLRSGSMEDVSMESRKVVSGN